MTGSNCTELTLRGPLPGSTVVLTGTALVGRHASANVTIADPCCSRHHACIWREGDAWWIRDLNTANGTFLDGVRVQQAALTPGARIGFGSASAVHLRVGSDGPEHDEPDGDDPTAPGGEELAPAAGPVLELTVDGLGNVVSVQYTVPGTPLCPPLAPRSHHALCLLLVRARQEDVGARAGGNLAGALQLDDLVEELGLSSRNSVYTLVRRLKQELRAEGVPDADTQVYFVRAGGLRFRGEAVIVRAGHS